MVQMPLTIITWLSISSQNAFIFFVVLVMIALGLKAGSMLYSYVDNRESHQAFMQIPCALLFALALSFTSFWSLLMIGCSNDKTFSFGPFIFASIQLFFTCIWCNVYCSVASHVAKHSRGGGYNYNDDYYMQAWVRQFRHYNSVYLNHFSKRMHFQIFHFFIY